MEPTHDLPLSNKELAEIAQARMSFCALINMPLLAVPNLEFVQRIRGHEFAAGLQVIAEHTTLHPDLVTGAKAMQDYVSATMGIEISQVAEMLGAERGKLYRGVAADQGPQAPYETNWTNVAAQEPAVLQDLAETYAAAGMIMVPERQERLDYVGVELEYVQQVAHQEVQAWQAGERTGAREFVQRQSTFVNAHLGAWVPAYVSAALEHARADFYRGHLLMLRGFVVEEQKRLEAVIEELDEKPE